MAIKNTQSVVIVGGGIFGLTTAWFCAAQGMSVTLVEKDRIAAGASGGIMGTLSPNVPETWSAKKQFQLDALLSAEAFWTAVETTSGIPTGYGRIGRLIPIPDERTLHHAKIREGDAVKLWQGHANWKVTDGSQFRDLIAPSIAPCGIIHENLSARIAPRAACASLAKALTLKGVTIVEDWPATKIVPNRVSGPRGEITADEIVIAAGVESFALLADFVGPDKGLGVKGQSALLTGVSLAGSPQIFADHVYIIPHADGTVAIGSTSENSWDDAYSTDDKLDQLIIKARAICPQLTNAAVGERWANLRPRGKKPDPMLGPVPGHKGINVATGGFKIAFGIAHSCGELVAAMISGEAPDIPLAFLVNA